MYEEFNNKSETNINNEMPAGGMNMPGQSGMNMHGQSGVNMPGQSGGYFAQPARAPQMMSDFTDVRKSYNNFGFGLFFWTLASYGLVISIQLLGLKFFPELAKSLLFELVSGTIPMYVAVIVLYLIIKGRPDNIKPVGGIDNGWFICLIIMCITVMMGGNIISNILASIIKAITGYETTNSTIELVSRMNPFWILVIVVIIGPFFEELVFRKMLLDKLSGYNERIAILASGILFGLFHTNFYQFFYATGIGLIFAYVYTRTGKIWRTWVMHMIVNTFGGLIPVLLLKHVDMNKLLEMADGLTAAGSEAEQMSIMQDFFSNPWVIVYYGFVMIELALAVTGLILFIINVKKFFVPLSEPVMPKGTGFKNTFLTLGMILYIVGIIILTVFLTIKTATPA